MFKEERFIHLFRQKGWSKKEIEDALRSFRRAEERKHPGLKFLEASVFWIGLVKAFCVNLIAAVVSIPLLLYFRGVTLHFFLAILGLSFGIILHIVIKDLENLSLKHHATALLFLPVTISLNFSTTVRIAQQIGARIGIQEVNNPVTVTLAYIIPYLIPYLILLLEEKRWRKSLKNG